MKFHGLEKRLLASFFSIAALLVSIPASAHVGEHLMGAKAEIITLKPADYRGTLKKLTVEGFDIAGVDVTNGTVDVIVSDSALKSLTALNLGSIIAKKAIDSTRGPDSAYFNYDKLTKFLKDTVQKYPSLAHMESIGKSIEGRDIWAVKITSETGNVQNKPVLFFNAMHHAREVMTTEVAVDLIDQLTSGFALNSKVQKWVKNTEIWVVPMVNPDGNNKVWTSNNMWRKNVHGGYGVDINRNYPFAWASCDGSSGSTYADDYHGPSAGSEPETKAMMGLVSKILPAMSISYHSYSELVIYPFGCDGQRTPDHATVEKIGNELAKTMKKDSGNGFYDPGTAWELLYAVDGGDIDWYYSEHHVLPFVIEVNAGTQGFQPPYSWRQKTVEKVRASWGYILDRALQSGIQGSIKVNNLLATSGHVSVKPINTNDVASSSIRTYKIKSNGTFNIVLDPGMYRVTVQSGESFAEQDVMIGAERVDVSTSL